MMDSMVVAEVMALVDARDDLALPGDAELFGGDHVDAIAAYEMLNRAAQARQHAHVSAMLADRRRDVRLGAADPELSVAGEIAMARGTSPSAGATQLALAQALHHLPLTWATFVEGLLSLDAVRNIARHSSHLTAEQCHQLDQRIALRLPGLSSHAAGELAAREAITIDHCAALERAQAHRADRRVTIHPDRDGVARLHATGPLEQVLAIAEALDVAATTSRAAGEARTHGQVMFDTLVERATGLTHAASVPIEIGLVMDQSTLLDDVLLPVDVPGHGPIAPGLALQLIEHAQTAWIRRLFNDPVTGVITDADRDRRLFTGILRKLITTRDRHCRQPFCSARHRQIDHLRDWALGGTTTPDNAQALCTRSHTLKHQPGWHVEATPDGTTWTTPTGHTYRSTTPTINPEPDQLRRRPRLMPQHRPRRQ